MKILLVDDEEQILKSVTRLIGIEEEDWEVETALSGEEALRLLAADRYDAIVSDMRMPGMDGADLLDRIEKDYPRMLRIVLSGQADRETVLRAVKPMHQYLAKPCAPAELFMALRRASIFQETIKSAEVLAAISQANCLPTFPDFVAEINHEIDSDTGTCESLGQIVMRDPVLTARILQLANSPLFAQRNQVTDIARAVALIGVDMLRSLAMSQALYSPESSPAGAATAKRLLEHGFDVAMTGKAIAKQCGLSLEDSGTVFSAGLLHDVGKLILLNAFPDRYESVVSKTINGQTLDVLEMQEFGATHQGIGAYLFELWGLPETLVAAVASHHSFAACAQLPHTPHQVVFAANWMVNNRPFEELQNMASECQDRDAADKFLNQIEQWQSMMLQAQEV